MRTWLSLALFLTLGLWVFFPALNSYFFVDDFVFLSLSRYVGNPFSFFVRDHFPGSFYYRPLGMFYWWLSYQLFHLDPVWHQLSNLLLHVLNGFVFWLLLRALFPAGGVVPLFGAILFVVHPVSVSTSLWLSDRFDLLATLFILLAAHLFHRFLSGRPATYYLGSLACICLGLLSKELAYVGPLIVTLIAILFRPEEEAVGWLGRILRLAPYYLICAGFYVLRFILLRGTDVYFIKDGFLASLGKGAANWVRFLMESSLYHFDPWGGEALLKGFLVLWVVFVGFVLLRSRDGRIGVPWGPPLLGLGIVGVSGLVVLPAMSLAIMARPGQEFSFLLVAEGRFYYLSLVGFLILLAWSIEVASLFLRRRRLPERSLIFLFLPFLIIAWFYGMASWTLSQKWAELTDGEGRAFLSVAAAAIQRVPSLEEGRKVYLLNTEAQSVYFRGFGDAVMKALAPRGSKMVHSLILTEKPPWYHFVLKADLPRLKVGPLVNMTFGGKDFPPLVVGNLAYLYLVFPEGRDMMSQIIGDPRAVFLEFLPSAGRFVDVTEQVRSGVRKVAFFNDRPDA